MYNFDTFMRNWMIIEDRLVVEEDAPLRSVKSLMEELESVSDEYKVFFSIDAFVTYKGLPKSMRTYLGQLPVGEKCIYGDVEIVKVSQNLCIGILLNVLYEYNALNLLDKDEIKQRQHYQNTTTERSVSKKTDRERIRLVG